MGEIQSCKHNLDCDNFIQVEPFINRNVKDNAMIFNTGLKDNTNNYKCETKFSNSQSSIMQENKQIYTLNTKGLTKNDPKDNNTLVERKIDQPSSCFLREVGNSLSNKCRTNQKFKDKEELYDYFDRKQSMEIKIQYNHGEKNDINANPKQNHNLTNKITTIFNEERGHNQEQNNVLSILKLKDSNENTNINQEIETSIITQKLTRVKSQLCFSIISNNANKKEFFDLKENDNKRTDLLEVTEKSQDLLHKIEMSPREQSGNHSQLGRSKDKKTENRNKAQTLDKLGSMNTQQSWRKEEVLSFIPEEKLINAEDNDVIFQSDLNIVTLPDGNKVIKPFSIKFSVLTKHEFKNYKSRESFYRFVQPLMRLSLVNVISCDVLSIDQTIFKKDKALKYNFFYIKYLFSEDKVERSFNSQYTEDSQKYNSRVVNINEENKRIRGKRMHLINPLKRSNIIKENNDKLFEMKSIFEKENCLDLNNTMVFASINKDLIHKWVCIVNHFIKK